jgi:PEP-CTERM motif
MMAMRRILLAAMLLSASGAMAQTVTVTPVAFPSYATNHADQFEFTDLSPYFGGTGSNYSDPRDAFGRATPNTAEPGSYVFSDFGGPGGTQEIGFNTLAPVTISGFDAYLYAPGGSRAFSAIQLLASLDNITFTNLGGVAFPSGYGADFVRVRSTFASQSYQYFRFRAQDVQAFLGGRVVEIDAISGTATLGAVPEPGSWVMMIAGFALVGAAARARRLSRHAAQPARPA